MGKRMLLTLAATIGLAAFVVSGIANATSSPTPTPKPKALTDDASVTYFTHGGSASLDQIRVVNQSGAQLCALYYVFDANQELSECCGCEISNDGETTTSLTELTDNPGNGIVATNGSILLVSSVDPDPKDADITDAVFGPTACDPASPKPAPQLLAWSTHAQVAGEITEEEFTQITLTSANLKNAASLCGFLEGNGSGPGVCDCSEEG
jgi:hypothetical protein